MDNVIYDRGFNANEWFVIAMIVIGGIAVLVFPKRFTPTQTAFNLMIGVVFGLMLDHTIALPPFDYYDVGDKAQSEFFDIFSYIMYCPFGYFYIYFFERLKIRGFKTLLYIAIWTCLGILIEWLGVNVGVFHYKHGYKLMYSVPIYLILESIHLGIYYMLFKIKRSGQN
jgi:hypothetical protein